MPIKFHPGFRCLVWGVLLFATRFDCAAQGPAAANSPPETVDESLRRHGILLSLQTLITALASTDPEVRLLAAHKLAQMGDKDAIPSLQTAFSAEPDGRNRINLALYLAQLGDKNAVDVLKGACSDPRATVELRILASTNLAIAGSDDCLVQVLSVLRASNDPQMVRMSLAVLVHFFSPTKPAPREVLDLICERLTHQSSLVRLTATDVLSRLGNSSQAQALEAALAKEPQEDVRSFMQRNLATLRKKAPR